MKLLISTIAAACIASGALAQAPLPAPPPEPVAVPAEDVTCDNADVTVYFAANEAMLSRYAARAVGAAAEDLAGCAVTSIHTIVLTSDVHTDEAQAMLADARATAVLSAFADYGITSKNITSDVVVRSDDSRSVSQIMPLARRVEVRFTAERAYGL